MLSGHKFCFDERTGTILIGADGVTKIAEGMTGRGRHSASWISAGYTQEQARRDFSPYAARTQQTTMESGRVQA